MSGSEYSISKVYKIFLIGAIAMIVMGVGILLFSDNLNKEWRKAPKYRTETVYLVLDQFFGKEAVSLGVVNEYDVPAKERKGVITYYPNEYKNEVIFYNRAFNDDTSAGDVAVLRSTEIKISVKAPAQKFYRMNEVQWKDNELKVTFEKKSPHPFINSLTLIAITSVAITAIMILPLLIWEKRWRAQKAQTINQK